MHTPLCVYMHTQVLTGKSKLRVCAYIHIHAFFSREDVGNPAYMGVSMFVHIRKRFARVFMSFSVSYYSFPRMYIHTHTHIYINIHA